MTISVGLREDALTDSENVNVRVLLVRSRLKDKSSGATKSSV